MRRVAFGLGANLGAAQAALQGAVDQLAPHLIRPAVSSVYETVPVGGPAQPDYLNAVLVGESDEPAEVLLARAHDAEALWLRTREVRWGPRTLDVDLLAVGHETSTDPGLLLPHPRAHERAFVLVPWGEVDPQAEIPGAGPVVGLAAYAATSAGVRRRPDLTLTVPG